MTEGKLVRDKIPDIIRSNGEEPEVTVLSEHEYRHQLLLKLVEEAQELLESGGSLEERADVAEVLRAIDKAFKFDTKELESVRLEKLKKRGGFVAGYFLHQ